MSGMMWGLHFDLLCCVVPWKRGGGGRDVGIVDRDASL